MAERTDSWGRWVSDDGGVSWTLVEPSEEFIADQTPDPPDPLAEALEAVEAATTLAELRTATLAYLSLLT